MEIDVLSWVLVAVAILEIPLFVLGNSWLNSRKEKAAADRRWEDRLRELENWKHHHDGEHWGFQRGLTQAARARAESADNATG